VAGGGPRVETEREGEREAWSREVAEKEEKQKNVSAIPVRQSATGGQKPTIWVDSRGRPNAPRFHHTTLAIEPSIF